MVRSCGGCTYFQKLKNDLTSSGLCERRDCRTDSDRICDDWKGIKYDRKETRLYSDDFYDESE